MKRILFTLLMTLTPFLAGAQQQVEVEGIYYDLSSDSSYTATVIAPPESPTGAPVVYSGDIVIQSTVTDEAMQEFRVVAIGDSAFMNCSEVTSVSMPSTLISIGNSAFAGTSMTSVDVPEGVTSISDFAFVGCTGLTTVSLPSTLKTLGSMVFLGCNLETITCLSTSVPLAQDNTFDSSNYTNATLIVPSSTGYSTITPWSNFGTITTSFDPGSPNEPAMGKTYVLAEMENVGEVEYEIPMTIDHGTATPYQIPVEATEIRSILSSLGITDINDAALHAEKTEGVVTDTLTAASGFWFDANEYVCQASDVNRRLSIAFRSDSTKFVLTQRPDVFADAESHNYALFFIYDNKYQQVNFAVTFSEPEYTVTFMADSTQLKSETLKYGTAITAPTDPEKTGFTFIGWNPTFESGTTVTGNVTYQARFTINNYLVKFIDTGVEVFADSLPYGYAITVPAAPTQTGYTFTGWWPEPPTTVPAADVICEATYIPNRYQVTFMSDVSTVIRSDSVTYNTLLTAPPAPEKEGYTFTGWDPAVPDTFNIADNAIYTAQYRINQYKVAFVLDGDTLQSAYLDYGTAIIPPTPEEKEGYTFNGWGSVESIVPAHDLVYDTLRIPNKYLLTFTVDDTVFQQDSVTFGSPIVAPATDPVKVGHTFNGWWDAASALATMPAWDVTYSAKFIPKTYTVAFLNYDGSTISSETQQYGTAINAPGNPERTGYTFTGWSPEVAATVPDSSVTYTATYRVNQYLITFTDAVGQISSEMKDYGTTLTAPTARPKEGYTFTGWLPEVPATVPADSVEYVAQYVINQYKVVFILDGDTLQSSSLDYGTAIVVPTVEPKEGYTFNGWGDVAETVPSHDLEYKANRVVNQYLITFTDAAGQISSEMMDYGTTLTAPTARPKEGYTFTGWEPAVPATVPADSVEYVAQYTINSYLVKFVIDGVTVKSDSLQYGSVITAYADTVRTGYTFSGWDKPVAATVPAGDVTYTASFTPNNYTVKFVSDTDSVISSTSLAYGAAIEKPADPTKEGHTFTGWLSDYTGTTVPDYDVTYKATFDINSYRLIYKVDDEIVADTLVKYASAITEREKPTQEGATFVGWIGFPESGTMPAKDVTVTGTFSTNAYKVTFIADNAKYSEAIVEYGKTIPLPTSKPTKEGYTFVNWGDVPATMPADSITLTAVFRINSYLVKFVIDGATVKSDSLTYGTAITAYADTVRTGYTFSGWDKPVAATVPAGDVTYTASFTPNNYTVKFVSDTDSVISSTSLAYGSAIEKPADPTKEGHTFTGWLSDYTGTTVPDYDVTYKATFDINSYRLIYKVDDVIVADTLVKYASAITEREKPTQEGATFIGWIGFPESGIMPAKDVTVTGTFSTNAYKVTFIADNAKYSEAIVEYGKTIPLPATNPTKEGYTFVNWGEVPETMPADSITLTAVFRINSYLVKFVIDGATVKSDSLTYGTAITAYADTVRTGYTFSGWDMPVAATVPAGDVTYTASFTPNNYTVKFVSDTDSVISSTSLAYGAAIEKPADPTKEGHTFTGWLSDYTGTTVPDYDVTYKATFDINSYRLIYKVDDVIVADTLVKYASAITEREKPTQEGATFIGWIGFPESGIMPAKDVTVTGTFSTNAYKVTFIADNAKYSEAIVEYGKTIPLPATNPTKEGYTFVNWGEVPETMPADSITLTAVFRINSYLVKFVIDGVTVKSDSLTYGTAITAYADTVKTGHTFSGWDMPVAATVPAGDLTYTASFTPNNYTVKFVSDTDSVISSTSLAYGAAIEKPADPTKEGHTFTGWLSDYTGTTVPDYDVTYKATFDINRYNLVYMVDDVIYVDTLPEYGTTITRPTDPKKEGYTFTGWKSEYTGKTVPAHDVTYIAQWQINQYNVTFKVDGSVYYTTRLDYGTVITAPADPTKEGHTFSGWKSNYTGTTVPDFDVTYEAEWDIDPDLVIAYGNLLDEQNKLDNRKASIDTLYNNGVADFQKLVTQYEAVKREASKFGNKFTAQTAEIDQRQNIVSYYISHYSDFEEKDFTAEIQDGYDQRNLLAHEAEIERKMNAYSSDLDSLRMAVEEVQGQIQTLTTDVESLQTDLAAAIVSPSIDGIAEVHDPMGGMDAMLQNKENVKKLIITGRMEATDFATLLNVPNVEELTLPLVNSTTDDIRLGSLSKLLVVNVTDAASVLNEEVFTGCNPNLMVYAPAGASVESQSCNVIIGDNAEEIVLTDSLPVRITDRFTAQRISYTRTFSKKTYMGQSAGWETIVLPFDVQAVTAADGRNLQPFGNAADEHYWLATIEENGFVSAQNINANVPYLISMPNNKSYGIHNVTGQVTFSATDAEVQSTVVGLDDKVGKYTLSPVYEGREAQADIYAINDEDYETYYPGAGFVAEVRNVRPFEASLMLNENSNDAKSRRLIPIGITSATGLIQIAADGIVGQPSGVFSIDGRKVAETTDNLPAGIYIVGGKKYIVQ